MNDDRFEPSDAHLSLRAKLRIWAANLAAQSRNTIETATVQLHPAKED